MLRRLWEVLVVGRPSEPQVGGGSRDIPVRWNLLVVAFFIAALSGALMFLTYVAMTQNNEDNQFIVGALIGLLPTGIAGLVTLGSQLLGESTSGNRGSSNE